MHNIVIAKDIAAKLLEMIKSDPNIKKVLVKVGEMVITGHHPEDVEKTFAEISKGTLIEGIKLKIEIVKMKAICENCGQEYEFGEQMFECSKCGSAEFKLITGEELVVEKIE